MSKFKKGDKVRIIGNTVIIHHLKMGSEGKVVKVTSNSNNYLYYYIEGISNYGNITTQYVDEVDMEFLNKKCYLDDSLFEI